MAKTYEVRDVIYGFVLLDEQERDIINEPAFQRLRRIRQLSFTEMVYPGANHTRFEHSLGVMQMASDMYDCIIEKSPKVIEELGLDEAGKKRWRKVVRLAALLHDIGHPPFSHAGEDLLPTLNEGSDKRYTHEDYSIAIIKEKFKTSIEDHPINRNYAIKVNEVTALLGDITGDNGALNSFTLLWKSLISGQVDADRADYLIRDSIHSGVSYGLYDRNRLIRCLFLCNTDTGAPIITISEGGCHIAEALVIARYQMFTQIYFHKVRRIYDYHVSLAAKKILENRGVENSCYPSTAHIDEYLTYDDWTMWGEIKAGHGEKHGDIVLTRQHYKCAFETQIVPTEEDNQRIEEIKEECRKRNSEYFIDNPKTTWYKIDKDIPIRLKSGAILALSEMSGIVKSMVSIPTTRIYVERSVRNGAL